MNSSTLRDYVNIFITLPDEIKYPAKEDTMAVEGNFPGRIYTAWNEQRKEAISQSHFEIHFLRNFQDIIDSLINGNLTL